MKSHSYSNKSLAEKLTELKKETDNNKTELANLEGQLSQLKKQRIELYGCETSEQADEYIKELNEGIIKLTRESEEGLKTIEEELGWR